MDSCYTRNASNSAGGWYNGAGGANPTASGDITIFSNILINAHLVPSNSFLLKVNVFWVDGMIDEGYT